MNVTLEYLAVGLLIVTILLAFNQVAGSLTPRLESVRSEQLFTVAERVMDKIVLTPGYPEDWGRDIEVTPETLKDFGLALAGSRSPYVLDPDKVMRLANLSTLPNPLLLNASRLAELLALGGNYGFRLVLKPALTISIEPISIEPKSNFKITVFNYYNVGITNANVTGIYITFRSANEAGSTTKIYMLSRSVRSCLTNERGSCTLDFTHDSSETSNNFILIVHVNWHGLVGIDACSKDECGGEGEGYIIGKCVFIRRKGVEVDDEGLGLVPDDNLVQAVPTIASFVFAKIQWLGDDNYNHPCNAIIRVNPSASQTYRIGNISYVETLSSHVFVFIRSKEQNEMEVITIKRLPIIEVTFGARGGIPANAVTLRRLAVLYNYPYVVELTIWRRVEGWP